MVELLSQYWGFAAGLIFVVVGVFVGSKTAKVSAYTYAKDMAIKYMLVAEKKAEELMLANGKEKLKFVIDSVYGMFPAKVRVFISLAQFEALAQGWFDEIVSMIETKTEESVESTIVDTTPTAQPSAIKVSDEQATSQE